MTPESIQHLLASRRPGDEHTDPDVMAALRSIESDPTALSIAEREMAFDEAFRASLHAQIPVPQGLQARLLAIPTTVTISAEPKNVTPFSRRNFLGLAASLAGAAAVVAGGYFMFRPKLEPGRIAFTHWKNAAAAWASAPKLELEAPELATLRARLASRGAIVPESLPARLEGLNTAGCQTIKVGNGDISIVCFLKDGTLYHLFTTNASQVADATEFLQSTGPKIWAEQGWNFASWKTGGQGFMLLTKASEDQLKQLFV